jgi:prepilin-type processing-associated H-X9-DG protein
MEMQPYPEDEPLFYEQDLWTPGPYNEMRRGCVSRHNGAVNAVFLDISARKIGLKELWKLKWHREWPEDYPPPMWPEWMENFKDY